MKKFLYLLIFFTTPFYGMMRRRMFVETYNRNRQSSSDRSETIDRFSVNYVNQSELLLLRLRVLQIAIQRNLDQKKERIFHPSRNCNSKRDF